MSRLTWTERNYNSGVDHGVVYSRSGSVEVWNGLISVTEKPSDIRERVRYRDGVKIVNQRAEDSFAATIECFTYPDTLSNPRSIFDLSYRTRTAKGYEFHLVYNALSRITGSDYRQQETTPLTFDIWTRPRPMPANSAPSAHIIIDSAYAGPDAVTALEDILYGDVGADPRFPQPEELMEAFELNAPYKVIDNGDGTFTLEAPDHAFDEITTEFFEVEWPRPPVFVDEHTYTIRNW